MVAPRVLLGLLSLLALLLAAPEVGAVNVDLNGDFTTTLDVSADGAYDFALLGEGGTKVFIDGVLVVDGSSSSGSTWLAQGIHALEIQFDDCCGGIQLVLPENVAMQPVNVPEPHTLILLGAALAVLAVAARMRTRGSVVAVRAAAQPSDRAA